MSTNQPSEATLVLDAKATLGEGAIWHPEEKKLYWVDIEGKALHIFDPATNQDKQFPTSARIGTVVPVAGGCALVALQNGIHKMDTETGELTFITNPLQEPDIRFNDGKCDPAGRFWVGTIALDAREGAAVLYRMRRDQSMQQMLDGVTNSNGICWSLDAKTMYYIDTPTLAVDAFDFDNISGKLSNRRTIIHIPKGEGQPDGMTIDAEGKLWVALHGGGAVTRWDPETGKLLQKVTVPAPNTTSCAFGGENLEVLYITTAREGLNEQELNQYPQSGGLFAVKPGVQGIPADFFIEKGLAVV
ncbi:SMP-30/gluconolactonase/LRE family protein [Botryobacter ruber]|uniref:SMP-30/gluconolactonase/LRE family protein n=1 Tax=Botryobacter ruber TaxID=2171629 RepID=UPI000E0BE89B|nr:SMP-30/gluconolactonase/LRE family protein [Botryobacter ruber]